MPWSMLHFNPLCCITMQKLLILSARLVVDSQVDPGMPRLLAWMMHGNS